MLPANYLWLKGVEVPKVIASAIQYLGVKEVVGKGSNPVIMNMAKQIGVDGIYKDDDEPWCAVLANFVCFISDKPLAPFGNDIYNKLRAKSFLNWGEPVAKGDERIGDVVVLKRDGGYHVFFLIAKNKVGNFIGIGGNQRNMVNIDIFDKNRVAGVRRLYKNGLPAYAKQYVIDDNGKFSTNED